jgi:signal transduction histidine kinase/ActR/RegA family two-component response regulator
LVKGKPFHLTLSQTELMPNVDHIENRSFVPFQRLITAAGTLALLYAVVSLNPSQLDTRFAALLGMTLLLSSRIVVPIPKLSSQVSVSDTFVFLILLLYGPPAAIIVASSEAFLSSMRFSRKPQTVLFNWGCAALSVFITGSTLKIAFGTTTSLLSQPYTARFMIAICTMALVHYAGNSGIVAIGQALKTDEPIWQTWRRHYLWTSITYFAGAITAAAIAGLVKSIGFPAFVISLPIIAIVFLTYRTYLKNVETSAAAADQAEKHVKELSHYIAEQERIREQFTQLEKLSALGELASGVAHDFNNTLAGILGRAQLLQRTNDPEKIKRGLDIIVKTAEDGAKTVKRIQDFARQRRDHDFGLVSVDQILTDASEITRPRWKACAEAANIHISVDLQIHSNAMVMGDDSELREVLINMVFNAIDAMPEGGTLTLATSVLGETVSITISDTGVGMYSEVKSRVFDPFFTTKGTAGLGLGLAVSFGIIRRHGGNIDVESQYGKGSQFRITLPLASVAKLELPSVNPATQASTTSVTPTSGSDKTKILVVDDEDFVRELLKEILELEGCEVHMAGSGKEALEIFTTSRFDCLFTDVGMPGMSGWELAQAIREQNESIPIAVVTGWGEAVGSNEQRAARVDWVVAKPFTADRIVELVKEVDRKCREARKLASFSIAAA